MPPKSAMNKSTATVKPPKENDPSEKEQDILRALLYDSLLGSQPLIAMNVRASLQILLVHLGRPKLAKMVEAL